ncbi:MAG: flagellar type III secretion system pore protein FliP [Deltaproteobacteria bacterium]|nr:flagellar type III secretion system pore protein FliP [Deltaproteobacteria bacterium]
MKGRVTMLAGVGLAILVLPNVAVALPGIDISIGSTDEPDKLVTGLKLLGLFTVLAIAPAILMTMTSFTRIIIVFSFLRQAIGTQQVPPNQVMIGLALFLTIFVMAPVGARINEEAITPYSEGKLTEGEAFDLAAIPMREFMLTYTREKDLGLFYEISGLPLPNTVEDVSLKALVPAFVISELKTAFEMGFMLFVPFIVLDIAIASMLMSMGMIMLPPALISLPLKLMLFVLVDGWNLIVGSMIRSFQVMS